MIYQFYLKEIPVRATTAVIILLALLVPLLTANLATAYSPEYYLNHPDPAVRQDYINKLESNVQKQKNETYEQYGTNDPEKIAAMKKFSREMDQTRKEAAEKEREGKANLTFWESFKEDVLDDISPADWLKLSCLFGFFIWIFSWAYKQNKRNKAALKPETVAETAPKPVQQKATESKTDKIARRTLEKEKILAGESLKTK